MVLLQYDYSVDTNDAYLDLRAALDSVERSLPDDCQSPIVMKMVSIPSQYDVFLNTTDGSDVLSLANDEIVPELKAVSSVASVEVSGGRENYIQVKLDEEAMNQYGLTMSSIAQFIATTDFTVPIGSLEQGTQSISAISTGGCDHCRGFAGDSVVYRYRQYDSPVGCGGRAVVPEGSGQHQPL